CSSFYPQVVDFVKRHTGARRVVVFDHTIRKRLAADLQQQTTVQRPAVMLVHSDYTPVSGPQRVHDIVPEDAEGLLERRVAFY
ncbi:CmcJ/NvfI family oxidoreductase, partial [Roseateles sp. GG27B]